jgi:hypothetical protein
MELTKINNHCYDFSSIKFMTSIPGAPQVLRVSSISYSHNLEVGELRGIGAGIYGTTRGDYNTEGSLSVYIEDWETMRKALMLTEGVGGFMERRFDIQVIYGELGGTTILDFLRGVRVTGSNKAPQRGNEPIMAELSLHIMQIFENGDPAFIDSSSLASL